MIAVVTAIVTAAATTFTTTKILETKLAVMDSRLTHVEDLTSKIKSEQDKRTYIIDGARRLLQHDERKGN